MSKKISELCVGDTVAIEQRNSLYKQQSPYSLDWVVTKITPTGQVVVEKQLACMSKRRFDKRGVELGVGNYFPSLEPDHLKAVREVHLWKLLDNVRKALDAMRHELNSGAMPATHAEHRDLDIRINILREAYSNAISIAYDKGALK